MPNDVRRMLLSLVYHYFVVVHFFIFFIMVCLHVTWHHWAQIENIVVVAERPRLVLH